MAIDSTIGMAVQEVVNELGEDKELAKKILHWIEAIHTGETQLEDKDAVKLRIEILLGGLEDVA